jgi:crotonobetainyl-CoA:carnitine CoA-transferase CaiB-like acyl-CoA transferase
LDTQSFHELVRLAGLTPPGAAEIRIAGDDPVYPSPLPLGRGAATALAMVAAGIDDIWYAGTGRRQPIAIDLQHAAVTISGMWVLRIDEQLATQKFAGDGPGMPTLGTFRCRDGRWILLMDTFPGLATAALGVLGCEPAPEAIRAAIALRDSDELEAAFVAARSTGVVIRDHREWLQHPQGQWLRDVPVVEIERIGDAGPIPLPRGARPLSGLRVIDSTRVLAGPTISRTLAEFGADVLHIGSPNVPDLEAAQADTGHGKRRAFIDLDQPEGPDLLSELVRGADVFSQSYRAGAMEQRGFGPKAVAELRPGVIYVSENCYGQGGPWQHKRGFDGNAQAASGIMLLNARDPQQGLQSGGPAMAMNDYCTGYWGAYGVLEALQRRAREGGSWHVKVSLSQTARWFMRMDTLPGTPPAVSAAEIMAIVDRYAEALDSDYGVLRRLKPVIQMPETPSHWSRRTVLPGMDEPRWVD